MKNLNQFIRFDFEQFAEGKVFQVNGVKPWKDYDNSEKVLGTQLRFLSRRIRRTTLPATAAGFPTAGRDFQSRFPLRV